MYLYSIVYQPVVSFMLDDWLSSWHRKMSVEVWNNYPIRLGRVRPLCGDGEAGLRHKPGQGSGKTSSMCRENLPMPLQKSIFSLNLYIFRLKIHIFRLNLYIFSLKMKFSAALHLFFGCIGRISGYRGEAFPVYGRWRGEALGAVRYKKGCPTSVGQPCYGDTPVEVRRFISPPKCRWSSAVRQSCGTSSSR